MISFAGWFDCLSAKSGPDVYFLVFVRCISGREFDFEGKDFQFKEIAGSFTSCQFFLCDSHYRDGWIYLRSGNSICRGTEL